jgi:hypothetical protein
MGDVGMARAEMKKVAANIFIVLILGIFILDAMPAYWKPHQRLQARLDALVDFTGIWQGRWRLFAPTVDKENTYVTAKLHFDDGTVHHWRQPEWRRMSVLQRHRSFRQMEYFDSIRMNENKGAWEAMADHLARIEGRRVSGGPLPNKVELTRHWYTFKGPPRDLGHFERIQLPEEVFKSYLFHTWRRRP